MNVSPNRLFSHPVLWFLSDDYTKGSFDLNYTHEQSFHELTLHCHFSLDNQELLQQIERKEVAYALHVECPLTMYRKSFFLHHTQGTFILDTARLQGKVELQPVLVAMKDFQYFENQDHHLDYKQIPLFVPKGAILGVARSSYLQIEKVHNDLGKKSSIFSFVKNKKNEPMKIDTDQDTIIIKLKEKDFNHLQMLQSSSTYQPVIYALFIVPALIFALDSIDEDLELMRDKLWFRSLEKVFLENHLILNKETVALKTSYGLSQLLLEDPISKALEVLMESGGDH